MKCNEIIQEGEEFNTSRSSVFRGSVPEPKDDIYKNSASSEIFIKKMRTTYPTILSKVLTQQHAPEDVIHQAVKDLLQDMAENKYDPDLASYFIDYKLTDLGYESSEDLARHLGIIDDRMNEIKRS